MADEMNMTEDTKEAEAAETPEGEVPAAEPMAEGDDEEMPAPAEDAPETPETPIV